jgi:DNA-binding XRE family transcriptional regulator
MPSSNDVKRDSGSTTVDRDRWKRLEEKGWQEGDAATFLGLSPEEGAYVELKLRLAAEVKALRARQSLTQVELASLLGSSQSRVAKIEKGDPSVSLDLLTRSMLALGATRQDIARAIGGR